MKLLIDFCTQKNEREREREKREERGERGEWRKRAQIKRNMWTLESLTKIHASKKQVVDFSHCGYTFFTNCYIC